MWPWNSLIMMKIVLFSLPLTLAVLGGENSPSCVTPDDECFLAVKGPRPFPSIMSRHRVDCSSFLRATVTPATQWTSPAFHHSPAQRTHSDADWRRWLGELPERPRQPRRPPSHEGMTNAKNAKWSWPRPIFPFTLQFVLPPRRTAVLAIA